MEQWLLWGLTLYGAVWFLLLQGIRTFGLRFPNRCNHLILFTKDSQGSLEWVIRSFFLWNWFRGQECWITCIDEESVDDTPIILQRLQSQYPRLKLLSKDDTLTKDLIREAHGDSTTIIIDLKREASSLPQLLSEKKETSVKAEI